MSLLAASLMLFAISFWCCFVSITVIMFLILVLIITFWSVLSLWMDVWDFFQETAVVGLMMPPIFRGKMLPPTTSRSPESIGCPTKNAKKPRKWEDEEKKRNIWYRLVDFGWFARKVMHWLRSVVELGFFCLQVFHPQIGCHYIYICIYIYIYICKYIYIHCLGASRV